MMIYQAKLAVPFGVLGIRCDGTALLGVEFLPATDVPQQPVSAMAEAVCVQLLRYFADPDAPFTMPLRYAASAHREKVWQAMLSIPRGTTRSYGELASQLHSCAQAVGQACGANPIPIVIPCHRVVGKSSLGGFMHHAEGSPLNIKRWLLNHEQR